MICSFACGEPVKRMRQQQLRARLSPVEEGQRTNDLASQRSQTKQGQRGTPSRPRGAAAGAGGPDRVRRASRVLTSGTTPCKRQPILERGLASVPRTATKTCSRCSSNWDSLVRTRTAQIGPQYLRSRRTRPARPCPRLHLDALLFPPTMEQRAHKQLRVAVGKVIEVPLQGPSTARGKRNPAKIQRLILANSKRN
jgi:hypothetical protein